MPERSGEDNNSMMAEESVWGFAAFEQTFHHGV